MALGGPECRCSPLYEGCITRSGRCSTQCLFCTTILPQLMIIAHAKYSTGYAGIFSDTAYHITSSSMSKPVTPILRLRRDQGDLGNGCLFLCLVPETCILSLIFPANSSNTTLEISSTLMRLSVPVRGLTPHCYQKFLWNFRLHDIQLFIEEKYFQFFFSA